MDSDSTEEVTGECVFAAESKLAEVRGECRGEGDLVPSTMLVRSSELGERCRMNHADDDVNCDCGMDCGRGESRGDVLLLLPLNGLG